MHGFSSFNQILLNLFDVLITHFSANIEEEICQMV